jgi:hypothetical protein
MQYFVAVKLTNNYKELEMQQSKTEQIGELKWPVELSKQNSKLSIGHMKSLVTW